MHVLSIRFASLTQQQRLEAWLRTFSPEEQAMLVQIAEQALQEQKQGGLPRLGQEADFQKWHHVQMAEQAGKGSSKVRQLFGILKRLYLERTRLQQARRRPAPETGTQETDPHRRLSTVQEKLHLIGTLIKALVAEKTTTAAAP